MNFYDLKAGDIDPNFGKKIKTIIYSTNGVIDAVVYIDEDDVIQWLCEKVEDGQEFGLVINKMSYWETICNKIFTKAEAYENKCLLAEGISRIFALSSERFNNANQILDITIDKIKIEGENKLRNSYVLASVCSFGLVALFLIAELLLKRYIVNILGYEIYAILMTALMGGVGAFISAITRAKDFKPDIIVDKKIHQIDGILRIVLGILTASFVWIGIKANLLFGFLNNVEKSNYVFLFLGMISGISERILPSIVKQFEDKVNSPMQEQ
jgi:hypothetical protein